MGLHQAVNEERKLNRLIGKKMAVIRRTSGLSRREVANMLGISQQQYSKYETGANRISAARLCLVAQALNVTFTRFLPDTFQEPFTMEPLDRAQFRLMQLIKETKNDPISKGIVELITFALVKHINRNR